MSNPLRTWAALLVCSFVAVACLLMLYRRENDSAQIANQELAQLKLRLETVEGELAAIKDRVNHDANPAVQLVPAQTPPADLAEATRWLAQLVVQQSNMLAAVQGQAGLSSSNVSPEKALLVRQAGITRLQEHLAETTEKAATARSRLVELMNQLGVPDEVAALDISTALNTPSLQKYWPYFAAKREYEERQDFLRLVERKLRVEELDMGIDTARLKAGE